MHSENIVEKGLPENTVLESWFDDMVRVEFFKEQEEIDEKCGKKHKKMNEAGDCSCNDCPASECTCDSNCDKCDCNTVEESLQEAFDKLNMCFDQDEFVAQLKEYKENNILNDIFEMAMIDSNLWTAIKEAGVLGDVNDLARGQEEDPLKAAYLELEERVSQKKESLQAVIQEISKRFDDPESIANALYSAAEKSGLAKHDFGRTQADDVMSPNDEVEQAKKEHEVEEFYGPSEFGMDEELNRIRELSGIKQLSELNEAVSITEDADCGCGSNCKCAGQCDGKCGDENCPCECGERTGKGLNECRLSNVTMEEIEPELNEQFTDQNLARIIQLAKYRNK